MELPDIQAILEKVLFEFPLRQLQIRIPKWIQALPPEHPLIEEIFTTLSFDGQITKMRHYAELLSTFKASENIKGISLDKILLGEGAVTYDLLVKQDLFYEILGEECGTEIKGDYHLI